MCKFQGVRTTLGPPEDYLQQYDSYYSQDLLHPLAKNSKELVLTNVLISVKLMGGELRRWGPRYS